jgi:hypothetical protein
VRFAGEGGEQNPGPGIAAASHAGQSAPQDARDQLGKQVFLKDGEFAGDPRFTDSRRKRRDIVYDKWAQPALVKGCYEAGAQAFDIVRT